MVHSYKGDRALLKFEEKRMDKPIASLIPSARNTSGISYAEFGGLVVKRNYRGRKSYLLIAAMADHILSRADLDFIVTSTMPANLNIVLSVAQKKKIATCLLDETLVNNDSIKPNIILYFPNESHTYRQELLASRACVAVEDFTAKQNKKLFVVVPPTIDVYALKKAG